MAARRKTLSRLAALAAAPLAASPFRHVHAQTAKPIRIGYLHIPTCDAQMWLMKELGTYAKEGLDPTFTRFNTGIEGFSALVGGSVDVLTTGGVTHNFPARGQGIVVLPNCVEYGGQVFGRGDAGVNTLKDLKGKKVATTLGTTGQIILHTALKSVGLDSTKDVEIISQTVPAAVTSFVTGSVAALSTWVPFNLRARDAKTAEQLAEAHQCAPKAGYVVSAQTKYYKDDMDMANMRANFDAMDLYDAGKWSAMMKDGTLVGMLDSVTNIFVEIGAMQSPLPASKYSDFALFSSTYKA